MNNESISSVYSKPIPGNEGSSYISFSKDFVYKCFGERVEEDYEGLSKEEVEELLFGKEKDK